jgi:hypothetical protein
LRPQVLARFLHEGGQHGAGGVHILGMDQVKGIAPEEFFWPIAQ